MRKLVTMLLLLLTTGAYAQESSTDSKTILDVSLEEVVVTSRVIDVAKEKRDTNCRKYNLSTKRCC